MEHLSEEKLQLASGDLNHLSNDEELHLSNCLQCKQSFEAYKLISAYSSGEEIPALSENFSESVLLKKSESKIPEWLYELWPLAFIIPGFVFMFKDAPSFKFSELIPAEGSMIPDLFSSNQFLIISSLCILLFLYAIDQFAVKYKRNI